MGLQLKSSEIGCVVSEGHSRPVAHQSLSSGHKSGTVKPGKQLLLKLFAECVGMGKRGGLRYTKSYIYEAILTTGRQEGMSLLTWCRNGS